MPLDIEELVTTIASLGRDELTGRLLSFQSDFPMDFTREYLDRLTVERLQHILLAAHLYQTRKRQKASA